MFGFELLDGLGDRFGEGVEVVQRACGQGQFFHQFPNTPDQVQIGRVRRQEQQFNVERLGALTNRFGAVIRCVVQHDRHRLAATTFDMAQEFTHLFGADRSTVDHRDHFCRAVANRAEHIQPLPARAGNSIL